MTCRRAQRLHWMLDAPYHSRDPVSQKELTTGNEKSVNHSEGLLVPAFPRRRTGRLSIN